MAKSETSGYIAELDGLRGIAIALVMLHRFYPRADGTPWPIEGGWVGVDLFFVISGFLIAGILLDTREDPDYFRNFYARRLLRIFPLFYLFVGVVLVTFPVESRIWYLIQLGNVPESLLGHEPPYWLAPVWSLAIEEQFYLTFPLLVRKIEPRRLARWLIGFAVLALVTRIVTMQLYPERERVQYLFTLCRLDTIAAGCLIALLVRRVPIARLRARWTKALLGVVAGFAIVSVLTQLDRTTTFGRSLGYSIVAIGFAAVVLLVVLYRDRRFTAPLRWAPLRYMGKLCFGIYLLHRPADTIVSLVYSGTGLWAVGVKVLVAVGLATLSWHVIEMPFLRLKRHFASGRHPAPAIALAALVVLGCSPHTFGGGDDHPDGGRDGNVVVVDADVADDLPIPPSPAEHVLYVEGRVHSPITSEIVQALAALPTGGRTNVFAKVGDSITATTSFLSCFATGPVDLGTHGDVAATRTYFLAGDAAGTSPFARISAAAHGGWMTGDELAGSPPPLDQEVTAIVPRYAVVMLGTNDIRFGRTIDDAGADLWTIVDRLRAAGVIPILSTIPANLGDPGSNARIPLFNRVVRAIAQGRGVPLIDYHLAMSALANEGIDTDGLHPTVSPDGACVLTDAGLTYGYNLRNLVTLEALERTRRAASGDVLDTDAPIRAGSGTSADPFTGTAPLVDLGDTRNTASASYCGVTGNAVIYRIDLASSRSLQVSVVDRAGVNVDVAIAANSACVASGDQTASATVGPGSVDIVVLGRTNGEYVLVVQ